jgi:NAD-reducing hydrogenase small subunit
MKKVRVATMWLDECSGCHMSFLDVDEAIIGLSDRIELLYSPLVDAKEMPEEVDVFLVMGSVSSEEDLRKLREARQRTKILAAFGDCAVTGNVPSMRNFFGAEAALQRAYVENVTLNPQVPREVVPALLERVRPLHEVVTVDEYIQGCPPSADLILFILGELLEGRIPGRGIKTKFG